MPAKRKAAADDIDPAKMKVADLKAELTKRGLDASGKKAELVQRLEAALASDSTDSAAPPAKKKKTAKKEEAEEKPATVSEAMASLKTGGKKKKRKPKKDPHCHLFGYDVRDDWDCMLNQTNIGHNNNKYYVIQMLQRSDAGPYYVFYRWGRVGEPGQNSMDGAFKDVTAAEKAFKKKFQDKTRNKWEDRDNFAPVPGKYTLLEMEDDDDDDQAGRLAQMDQPDGPVVTQKTKPCSLPSSTQSLVKLLFDEDMFSDAMKGLEIDTKKLPLGKLSKPQIAKGFEVLEEIEEKLVGLHKGGPSLMELSSKFYTLIPHDFGRQRPPVINSREVLQKKKDILLVLADIEMAQSMQGGRKGKAAEAEAVHPLDEKYEMLKARLTPLGDSAEVRKVLETYLHETQGYRNLKILDMFEVDREGEGDRFSAHDSISNRRLLWHGTNVAVVAAILKTGLRIMPHSGGRVGKGIYFASENGKSAGYVRCSRNIGIMFLVEVALGKEHHIGIDDWTLKAPPKGYDCIIAKGRTEPDPKKDTRIKLEGKEITVPQGKPIQQSAWTNSSFWQSEYLVYKESQARLRYLLKIQF